jgi:hypothetical protein
MLVVSVHHCGFARAVRHRVDIFVAPSYGDALGTPVVVRKYHLSQPISTITITVDHEPKLPCIDPYDKLIDLTPNNNVIPIMIQHARN